MEGSLTVISLLFQSTTHCRYRVYTKFILTYTAIYRRNRKVLPLGITALQASVPLSLGHNLYIQQYFIQISHLFITYIISVVKNHYMFKPKGHH
jgi:hypothetical protein